MTSRPPGAASLRELGEEARLKLEQLKQRVSVPDFGWYPYQTMSSLPVVLDFIQPRLDEIWDGLSRSGLLDAGCGDGDLSVFFASLGCRVDAIDHAETNFNQLRGLRTVTSALAPDTGIFDVDLDQPFELPRRDYGLALFLGTFYHLRNPLYVLEKLAAAADWCILSTRIAQLSPRGTRIENEPVAYLLAAREANNDPTNFWIFSFAGLARLLERAGWMVVDHRRVGCTIDSNPVDSAADERIFVLAKSRTRHSGVYLRLLNGWHPGENGSFRWTEKQFGIELTVPEESRQFAIRFSVPHTVLSCGPIRVSCSIGAQSAGAITCDTPGTLEFWGRFPVQAITHQLLFTVDSQFQPSDDQRELGICFPITPGPSNTQGINLRLS